jgi:poly(hydroxyalkanoate) depolymerase family esterase
MNIQDTIDRAFASAGLKTDSGPMRQVTDTIHKALAAAGLASGTNPAGKTSPRPPRACRPPANSIADPSAEQPGRSDTIDVQAREVPDTALGADAEPPVQPGQVPPPTAEPLGKGRFVTRTYSSPVGTRVYKLYLPAQVSSAAPQSLALVMMLHGCTQNADDFATGTGMNRLADAHGFVVVYPEQASGANPSRCWNWFRAQDQLRDSGEPAIIAGIAQMVVADHPVDPARIFVAGLSAGAAMAVILGETYPELFAAVGAHSGLPYAAAHDVPSALAAMKGRGILGRAHLPGTPDDPRRPTRQAVPIIVFHGDRDRTVQQSNAEHIVQQASRAHAALTLGESLDAASLKIRTETGTTGSRRFTRTVHSDVSGRPRVETWTLHGAGHAWSGGCPDGSFTDPSGPDASAEMVRFFFSVGG